MAQMGVVEVFAAALGLKRNEGGMAPDVAWALDRKIDELNEPGSGALPLPKFKCHKEVRALQIAKIEELPNGGLRVVPVESRYSVFDVEPEFVPKHDPARPQVGWYYVEYENGYKSFSPAQAFEEGYTPLRG